MLPDSLWLQPSARGVAIGKGDSMSLSPPRRSVVRLFVLVMHGNPFELPDNQMSRCLPVERCLKRERVRKPEGLRTTFLYIEKLV